MHFKDQNLDREIHYRPTNPTYGKVSPNRLVKRM